MLSAKEIMEYVHGLKPVAAKEEFSLTEAWQIGKALDITWDTFDVEQFRMGLNVELEHGRRNPECDITHDEPLMTGRMALVHLMKVPDYYSRLADLAIKSEYANEPSRKEVFE